MRKRTKRRNNSRYSKKLSRKRFPKKRYSRKRLSRKRLSRKRLSRKRLSKRKMRGGSAFGSTRTENPDEEAKAIRLAIAASMAPAEPAEELSTIEKLRKLMAEGMGEDEAALAISTSGGDLEAALASHRQSKSEAVGSAAEEEDLGRIMDITGVNRAQATRALLATGGNLEAAIDSLTQYESGRRGRTEMPRLIGENARRVAGEEADVIEIDGFLRHKIQGDGDCLFTSIYYSMGSNDNLSRDAEGIRGVAYDQATLDLIRNEVANWLDLHWEDEYSDTHFDMDDERLFSLEETINEMCREGGVDKETYINTMRNTKAFAGKAETIALSNLYNLRITQYNRTPNRDEADTFSIKSYILYNPKAKGEDSPRPIYIVNRSGGRGVTAGDHYDALVPIDLPEGVPPGGGAADPAESAKWQCDACTFTNTNPKGSVCEMCQTQREDPPPPAYGSWRGEDEAPSPGADVIEFQTIPEGAIDKHIVYITGTCFWGELENIDKIVNGKFLNDILTQFRYGKGDVYFVFIDPGESMMDGEAPPDCGEVVKRVKTLRGEGYNVEFQKKYFCGSPEFSQPRNGRYHNYAIIMSGIFSYQQGDKTEVVQLLTDKTNGELKICNTETQQILDEKPNNYISLSMYRDVLLHECNFFKREDSNKIIHFFERIIQKGGSDFIEPQDIITIGGEDHVTDYCFYSFLKKHHPPPTLCEYMGNLLK